MPNAPSPPRTPQLRRGGAIWDTLLLPIQEQFYVIYLNRANQVLCWRCLHTGTCVSAMMDIKLLLATAYGCLAKSVLIAHNQPSGSLKPSKADLKLTNTIDLACDYNELTLPCSAVATRRRGWIISF